MRSLGANGFLGEPDWGQLSAQARVYLVAGAWQSAHDLLWPHLQSAWSVDPPQSEAIESYCLLLIACLRLGHVEHCAEGCARLEKVLERDSIPDPDIALLATVVLAQNSIQGGDYRAAQHSIKRLGQDTVREASSWAQSWFALLQASIALREGKLDAAEQHGLECARLAASAGSEWQCGDAHAILAIVVRTRGSLSEANMLFLKAAKHYHQSGNVTGHAVVLLNRGWVLSQIGLLPEGIKLIDESLALSTSLGRNATALRAQLGLAWADARRGALKSARSRLLASWRQARRLGLPRECALALEFLSETYTLSGALAKARVAVRLCKRLAHRIAPEGDIALEVKIREATLSLASGMIENSVHQAKDAIKHARKAGMRWEKAQAHRVLAMAQLRVGNRSEARTALRKALSLLDAMGEQLERQVVRAWLDKLNGSATGEPPGPTSPALTFWLNHPLLGPNEWTHERGNNGPLPAAPNESSVDIKLQRDSSIAGSADRSEAGSSAAGTSSISTHPIWAELGLVTRSPELLTTLRLAETYAPSAIPVLLLGETGAGKDLLAQGVHALSGHDGPLVPVNCAAASKELFVAELFGARRGAYTGSVEHRRGLIQEANGGTIFFDEIADLDPEAQGFLLRFLDTGEVRAIGATTNHRVQARVVAATCRDLSSQVQDGKFRKDLYGRLAGAILEIPPLRIRSDDFGPLIDMLWCRGGGDPSDCQTLFDTDLLVLLRHLRWPGNVRELKYLVDRALLFYRTHGATAARDDLLQWAQRPQYADTASPESAGQVQHAPAGGATPQDSNSSAPRRWRQRKWDPVLLRETLDAADGKITDAADALGISRSHAYRLYKALEGCEPEHS